MDIVNDFDLYQFVTEPSITSASRSTVLDLCLCNRPSTVTSVFVIPGISDHEAVVTTIKFSNAPRYKSEPKKVYIFGRADFDGLSFDLMDFLP